MEKQNIPTHYLPLQDLVKHIEADFKENRSRNPDLYKNEHKELFVILRLEAAYTRLYTAFRHLQRNRQRFKNQHSQSPVISSGEVLEQGG